MKNELIKLIEENISKYQKPINTLLNKTGAKIFDAPAFSKGEIAKEGGNAVYLHDCITTFLRMNTDQPISSNEDGVITLLAHNLCRVVDPSLNPYYVKNILKSGKVSESVPYKSSEEFHKLDQKQVSFYPGNMDSPNLDNNESIIHMFIKENEFIQGLLPSGFTSFYTLCHLSEHRDWSTNISDGIKYYDGLYGVNKGILNKVETPFTNLIQFIVKITSMKYR